MIRISNDLPIFTRFTHFTRLAETRVLERPEAFYPKYPDFFLFSPNSPTVRRLSGSTTLLPLIYLLILFIFRVNG